MKKNLTYLTMVILAAVSFTACSEDEGTMPGSDSEPVATIYTYSPELPYDADVDCSVRIATNSATQEIYYLAEKTTDYEARLSSGGESSIIDYIISNGTKASASAATPLDVVLQNLGGQYTIAVVAANGSTRSLATTTFTGYAWIDVAKGTYTFGYKYAERFFGYSSIETTLQYKEADPTQYRFKNLFGTGLHLVMTKTDYTTSDGGTYMRVSGQSTPFTYGSYGTIYVRDVATWQGSDDYLDNVLYEDGYCYLWLNWYVSAGYIGYAYDEFVPAE